MPDYASIPSCVFTVPAEEFETILVNRAHATWIDLDDVADGGGSELAEEPAPVYHASYVKDFTGA